MNLENKPELSPRQFQVAKLIAIGLSNRSIADQIGISVKTVDSHRGAIMRVLGLANNVELARYALKQGWVEL